MQQAAAMAVLLKTAGPGTTAGEGGASGAATGAGLFSLGTFFETALIITILMETAVATYIYRKQIADFINSSLFPKTEEIAAYPTGNASFTPAGIPVTGNQLATVTATLSPTVTVTVTGTPIPMLVTESSVPDLQDNVNNANLQVESTPQPNEDPGNHYGNTPKPERTQDSGKDSAGGQNTNNEDKGPKK
jgi:hypothetical protein